MTARWCSLITMIETISHQRFACLARLVYDDRITITRVAMTARCIEIGGARSMI